MEGRLSDDGREAVVDLVVFPSGSPHLSVTLPAIIDTGFTGDLTLPADVIASLPLPARGVLHAELANGTTTALAVYEAETAWHGRARRVLVYETPATALIGMSLLRGSTLNMEVVPAGRVTIAEPTAED